MNNHPTHTTYDAVIIGARAAGASTAMLMARSGLRVLAIDRQAYGSDTLSTHALMRGGVDRLARWGLLDAVWQQGSPVITDTVFTYGDETMALAVAPTPGVPGLAAPRRTVLDPILVDAARAAGADVLHRTKLVGLMRDPRGRVTDVQIECHDGTVVTVGCGLVIGADGLRSSVARAVDAPVTHQGRHASAYTMRYYADLDVDRHTFRWLYREGCGGGVIPTSGNAVCVFTAMTQQAFRSRAQGDIAGAHRRAAEHLDPALAQAIDRSRPLGPMRSFPGIPGRFRRPQGPGWALVGDAGYFKDPFAAHGITDAFRDAELLTAAVLADDLPGYETTRDERSMPLFSVLEQIASYQWDLDTLPGLHFQLSKAMKAEDQAAQSDLRPSADHSPLAA